MRVDDRMTPPGSGCASVTSRLDQGHSASAQQTSPVRDHMPEIVNPYLRMVPPCSLLQALAMDRPLRPAPTTTQSIAASSLRLLLRLREFHRPMAKC